jgi:hypothetical protein
MGEELATVTGNIRRQQHAVLSVLDATGPNSREQVS